MLYLKVLHDMISHDLMLMMTYYVETPEMVVSILSDGVGKPFSVRSAADDDLLFMICFQLIFQKQRSCPRTEY